MTMDAIQYRAFIEKLGLSQVAAARFLGIGDRSSRRYAALDGKGRAANDPIPVPIDLLLRVMVKHKISVTEACRLAGIDPKEVFLND